MNKNFLKIFFIALAWITVFADASHWTKFKMQKPYNRCSCSSNNNGGVTENPSTEKPPKPTPPIDRDEEENDWCIPYNPPTPDFSRPGRRVSTTKCYEYIWQIEVRIKRVDREKKCYYSKWDNGTLVYKRHAEIKSYEKYLSDDKSIKNYHVVKRQANDRADGDSHETEGISVMVLGGRDAFPKEFPHMGAVGWKSSDPSKEWKFMCGSSLISPKFALSAAHCKSASPRDTTILDVIPKIIRFGVEDIIALATDHSAEDRNISRILPHPIYRSPLKYYDIALFELDRPIVFSKFVQPACLWTDDMSKVKEGSVTGWGVTNPDAHEGHPYLQAAILNVVDSQTCEEKLSSYHNRRWPKLEDNQFCAGQMAGGIDACQGDSGGPFQTQIPLPNQVTIREGNMYYVIGVTSFGIGCGRKDLPAVYSKVSSFLDWIEPIVWP